MQLTRGRTFQLEEAKCTDAPRKRCFDVVRKYYKGQNSCSKMQEGGIPLSRRKELQQVVRSIRSLQAAVMTFC